MFIVGLAMMIWQMFAVKKLSSTALLTEKVIIYMEHLLIEFTFQSIQALT